MSAVREAPTHPLALGAAALVLVNDFVLREIVPGWLTGKLSDVGWLVVAPVLLASILARVGVPERVATRAAVAVTAVSYIALQLWPPLGQALRPGHVADLGDLLVLPALGLATLCWRRPRRHGAWAIPVLAGTLIADSEADYYEFSVPCGDDMSWDPDQPIRLAIGGGWDLPFNSENFQSAIVLRDEDGTRLPVVLAKDRSGEFSVLVCARDGLRGSATYTLEIGPWDETQSNQVNFQHPGLPPVTFTTRQGERVPVATPEECIALAHGMTTDDWGDCAQFDAPENAERIQPPDTADSGDSE